MPTVLVVDMANVVGSVPDGWWRDRVGAAERLLGGLDQLSGRTVSGPDANPIRVTRVVAVLEGSANRAAGPDASRSPQSLEIARASASGDDEIAAQVTDLVSAGDRVLVVTADRGLRLRLSPGADTTGPGWLNALLGRT